MKQFIIFTFILINSSLSMAQVGINTTNDIPANDAMLDVSSTSKGILIPRMSESQRDQITATSDGLMVYLTDLKLFSFYDGSQWINISETIISDKIIDADGDTYVHVEKNEDDDIIRLYQEGQETIKFIKSASSSNVTVSPTTYNSIFGRLAGSNLSSLSNRNTLFGALASQYSTSGTANTMLGFATGRNNNGGSGNLMVGLEAGANSSTSHSVLIGSYAGLNLSEDNRLIINSELTYNPNEEPEPFIYGEFDNHWLKIDGGLALGTMDDGSTGNKEAQLLISGEEDEGVNDGSNEGTYKLKIEGYQNDGNKVYPLAMFDEDGNMDFFIENKNSSTLNPQMYFDGELSLGGYDNNTDNHLILQTAGGNSLKAGIRFTHWSNQFGFTIESDDNVELDGADQTLLFKAHNYDVNGTIIGAANGDGNWVFGGTEIADGYKVSINGKMACEEVMVDLKADWPDYVFKEDYKLKTLEEVEQHINEKGHLPGVPSASEVADQGLKLGDMNKVMMEKIEELTLYMITQQKIIDKQQKQIDQLKNLIIERE